MRRLNKFLHLPSADRRLLVNSLWLIGAVRLGLWLLPFPRLRRVLTSLSKATSKLNEGDPIVIRRVAWAVTIASGYIPRATCLTQALATKVLLARSGQPAALRIGVSYGACGEFIAHAWVESNGDVVIGNENSTLKGFTSLPLAGEEII
jgi:hypothetical protein